jgi:transcriptional regulator with XRE-family HTH domain
MAKMPSKALRTLSENLARLIAASGELDSQAKVATKAKVDQKTVNRIANMLNEPSLDKVEKIAKAFGLEAWQLLVPGLAPGQTPELAQREQMEA